MTVLDPSCDSMPKEDRPTGGATSSADHDRKIPGQSGYFQRLFHAPNGNVFSVLSPRRRGRSCSMKPAFLCRQQQSQQPRTTRSRSGRRGGANRCLKFHNFIPSESITSEKDDGSHDDVWKVHAECKLQEEHGTKQIMVSQWSVSSSDAPAPPSAPVQATVEPRHHFSAPIEGTDVEKPSSTQLASRLRAEVARRHLAPTCLPPPSSPERSTHATGASPEETLRQHHQVSNQGLVVSAVTSSSLMPVPEESLTVTPANFIRASGSALFSELASTCGADDRPTRTDTTSPASPTVVDTGADSSRQSEILFDCLSKRNRRKPSQTRRVVPYRKYLSLLENDDVANGSHPLDLSLKTRARASEDYGVGASECWFPSSSSVSSTSPFVPCCLPTCSSQPYLPGVPSEHYRHLPYQGMHPSVSASSCFEKSPLQVALEAPLNTPPSRRLFGAFSQPSPLTALGHQSVVSAATSTTQLPFGYALYSTPTSAATSVRPSHTVQPPFPDCSATDGRSALMAVLQNCRDPRTSGRAGPSTSPSPSETPRGLRKPSQRSLIKQKLEDTFKQNGFLVKTKQVSDGDATFCKFRQLRKYTRYYLKSWHHHLPAEVHKLWKGFLPPKTLPGSAGPVDDVTRDTPQDSPPMP